MANLKIYRRGQLEWALWKLFAMGGRDAAPPPTVFRTRIKRLLEIDRTPVHPGPGYAFYDGAPEGLGSEVRYTAFNAFMIAAGLDLLDTGFKQGEAVFSLQHSRHLLQPIFDRIELKPPPMEHKLDTKNWNGLPTYQEDGQQYADPRVFMVLSRIEFEETIGKTGVKSSLQQPMVFTPWIARGLKQLHDKLHSRPFAQRKFFILELTFIAVKIIEHLEQAPLVKRGRVPARS